MILALTTHLLAAAAAPAPLPDPLAAGWQGHPVCQQLESKPHLRVLRCTFPPGTGHERHFHAAHWGYIVQGGTMRITTATGTVERELATGSSWWSDGVAWHEALNIGTTTAVYLIVEPRAAPAP